MSSLCAITADSVGGGGGGGLPPIDRMVRSSGWVLMVGVGVGVGVVGGGGGGGGAYPNNEFNVVLSACVRHVSSSAHSCVSKAGEEDCCHGPHPSDHCL